VRKRSIDYNIDAALAGALRSTGAHRKLRRYEVWKVWSKAVGETVSQQAQPAFVRGATLYVTCSSSAWMQQLQLMQAIILDKLNELLGGQRLRDIRFRLGVVVPGGTPDDNDDVHEDYAPDEGDRAWIEEVTGPLGDGELRDIVARVMTRDAARKKRNTGSGAGEE
jgi:hypothetical protein